MSSKRAKSLGVGHAPSLSLRKPYLIFLADVDDEVTAKTAFGLRDWIPDDICGQWRFSSKTIDFGLPDLTPQDAIAMGAKSVVIGAAPAGGILPAHWLSALCSAAELGLDIVSGLHMRLESVPELRPVAEISNAKLIDIRTPPENIPIGNGLTRPGKRVLTVGADCAIGKKYTALAIAKEMTAREWRHSFRATGQTGILIAGGGIPLDAVVSDFLSGAAETISPSATPDHWDVIEGQGSLFHPSYASVSLGLLHGSQPDAIVVCYDTRRTHIDGCPGYPIPNIQTTINRNLEAARLTNANVVCAGIAINTSKMSEAEAKLQIAKIEAEYSLPCCDPMRGVEPIVDRLGNI